MAAIAETVRAHGGVTLVDEIYLGLSYDAAFGHSALEHGDDVISINSFSKYFSMTGWRLGWMVLPNELVAPVEKLAQNLYICPPTVSQYAALACFEPETLAIYEERRAEFARRRDFLIPALREIGFIIPNTPEGAFYVFADISNFGSDSFFFCRDLLHQAGVAITPGRDFGDRDAEKYVRFTYTVPIEQLREVVERLRKFLGTRGK